MPRLQWFLHIMHTVIGVTALTVAIFALFDPCGAEPPAQSTGGQPP